MIAAKVRHANASLRKKDDAALVEAAGTGSSEAFEVLVRRYQVRIPQVRPDAENIIERTFHKA
jgi:tRNA A58 N-methylase Trm61